MSCLVASRNFSQAVSFKVDVLNWSGDEPALSAHAI